MTVVEELAWIASSWQFWLIASVAIPRVDTERDGDGRLVEHTSRQS